MRGARWLLFGALAISSACAAVIGVDEVFYNPSLDAGLDGGPNGSDAGASESGPGCKPVELCDNGEDDDCNGHVDCDDPACQAQGYTCVDALPDWRGPYIVWEADGSAPACSDSRYNAEVWQGTDSTPTNVPAADCSCTCGSASAACVSKIVFDKRSPVSDCDARCGEQLISSSSCTAVQFPAGCDPTVNYAVGVAEAPDGATCPPDGGKTLAPIVVAGRAARACTSGAKGCAQGRVCMPPRPVASVPVCVLQAGNATCPAGYPDQQVFNQIVDQRVCTPCTCGPPGGCQLSVRFNEAANCTSNPIGTSGQCTAINGTYGATVQGATRLTPSCAPSPVSADGGASIDGSTTVCCHP